MYTPDGSVIDVSYDEAIYDSFIFEGEKIVVLKNEEFDEFLNPETVVFKGKKQFLFGILFSKDETDYILPINKNDYDAVLEYYQSLKKAFLEVAEDGE